MPSRQWYAVSQFAATSASWATSFGGNTPAVDDVLLMYILSGSGAEVITGGLTAWSNVAGPTINPGTLDLAHWVYSKRAGASETAPTITFDVAHRGQVIIVCYRNVHADIWDGADVEATSATVGSISPAGSTALSNSMVVSFVGVDKSGAQTQPYFSVAGTSNPAMTVFSSTEDTGTEYTEMGAADGVKSAPGSWNVDWVFSSDNVVSWAGALKGTGAGGGGVTQHTVSLTDDELVAAAAVEGSNLLKVFVKDAAGNWSA